MKLSVSFKEQWQLIKPIWRVLLVILVAQILGGIVYLVIVPFEHPLINMWYGGTLSTLPGFLVGSLWHQLTAPSKLQNHKTVFILVGFMSLCLLLAGLFFPLENMASQLNQGQ